MTGLGRFARISAPPPSIGWQNSHDATFTELVRTHITKMWDTESHDERLDAAAKRFTIARNARVVDTQVARTSPISSLSSSLRSFF